MGHKVLVDGTGYNVKSGRTLIDGTGYAIKKGRTLIGGTGYDILLSALRLAEWHDHDGDAASITIISRAYDANEQSCTLTTKVSANTNDKAHMGFRLTGLQAGDIVTVDYEFTTTSDGNFYMECVFQFDGSDRGVLIETPPSSGKVTYTATNNAMNLFFMTGRAGTYTTKLTLKSITVNGEIVRYTG